MEHDDRSRVYVVDYHRQSRFYASWVHDCGVAVDWLHDFTADWEPPDDAALLVSAETYDEPSVSVLRRGVEKDIPVLILADGVLEYRNAWQNATQVCGNLLCPVLGHKLACLGASQARHVESWGSRGVCEVVGFPSFDDLPALRAARRERRAEDVCRVLVATARTPYFDAAQKAVVLEQFADLRRELTAWQGRSGHPIEVCWRLTGDVADAVGLDPARDVIAAGPLRDVLRHCDAVITTPSTLIVEAMLLDLPVAVLDYFNVPAYVSAAWRITAPQHLRGTLEELAQPPLSKMQFQRVALQDALECETPAAPRMIELARQMIAIGRDCRAQGCPLALPARILSARDAPSAGLVPSRNLVPSSAAHDVSALQLEVRHLRKALSWEQGLLAQRRRELLVYAGQLDGLRRQVDERVAPAGHLHAAVDMGQTATVRVVTRHVAPTRRLLMWGTGSLASALCDRWPDLFQALAGFVDSAPARQGVFRGKPVLSPDALVRGSDFVLVASAFRGEIGAQLQGRGLREIDDYLMLDDRSPLLAP